MQLGRAILRKLRFKIEFDPALGLTGLRTCDADGRLSVSALAAHKNGRGIQEWLDEGFVKVTILSHMIDVEEPSAAACISASRNKGQVIALPEHEWTAISTLNGLMIPANGDKSQEVIYMEFIQRARDVLGVDAVEQPLFKYVIELVLQLGGNQHSYVSSLIAFGEKLVDSKLRRCTYQLYKVACTLPRTAPECKVAMIKKHYSVTAGEDGKVPDPAHGWLAVKPEWLQQLEVMLRYLKLEACCSALAVRVAEKVHGEQAAERALKIVLNAEPRGRDRVRTGLFQKQTWDQCRNCSAGVGHSPPRLLRQVRCAR